jgi:predicted 3-demethylubiquinone-9 3-methyltransferase (glyoxalase superfamily)
MLLEKENVHEVQSHWRNKSGTPPPCVTVAWLHDKFGADKQCKMWTRNSVKSCSLTDNEVLRPCYTSSHNLKEVHMAMFS